MAVKVTDACSTLAAASPAEMVRAIAQGDAAAERSFAERYMKPVRAMLVARSRDPELASDLQQDVLIEAICALRRGQLREPEKLSAFVAGIARNRLNNYFRSARPMEPLEMPDELPAPAFEAARLEEEERETRAASAIATLDPTDRAILQMTLVDGLKPGVIAERLSMNPDVVRQRKLRATRRVIELVRISSQTAPPRHIIPGKTR